MIAAGMMVSLWLWASQNATDGDLSGCSDRAIAEAAEYKKKPGVFVTALIKTGWLDSDRKLHNWEEYATLLNDCAQQQREKTRERVKRHRERKKAASGESVTPECNGECNVTDTPGNAPTIPNHTIPNITIPNQEDNLPDAADGDAHAREADSEMLASIGLKPGDYPRVTQAQVERTLRLAKGLFARYRRCAPAPWDCRKVFEHSYSKEAAALLLYAFETAAVAGKADSWHYIDGILNQLSVRGIRTPEEARAWDADRPDRGESV